jgi:hypothetical protein
MRANGQSALFDWTEELGANITLARQIYRSDRWPIAFTKFGSSRRFRPPVRGTRFRHASFTERWIDADANCSMIIYNVGGASVADHKHLKWIKG